MALRDDAEARAVTVGAMLTAGWAVFSFYPIAVFPIIEGPKWTKGYSVNICFIVGCWGSFLIMQYLYKKSERKRHRGLAKDEEDMKNVDTKVGSEVEHTESKQ